MLSDRESHLERYWAAYERGRVPRLSDEELAKLTYYVSGGLTPELIPLWEAFNSFGRRLGLAEDGESVSDALDSYGVSQAGIEALTKVGMDHHACTERLVPTGFENEERLKELVGRASDRGRRAYVAGNLSAADIQAVAAATSKTPEEVTLLERQFRQGPVRMCAVPRLKALRAQLTQDDWEGIRRYLFREVAPRLTTMGYSDE